MLQQIGFGGGCHWCTEAVFQHLKGVHLVKQGWIANRAEQATFSEAVLVDYDPAIIPLSVLVEAHLITHSSTSLHGMRKKYRSAVYVLDSCQKMSVREIIKHLQPKFDKPLIVQTLDFGGFRDNEEHFKNYYLNKPEAPFCGQYIQPKLALLQERLGEYFSPPL
ncbi:peptide-methionine (S)-S-oxide reductase [Echinicola rosea]|uniref:peptide-methionine (S)-S-oxide reductase n=1 Tax=Echinicola rosea TaxID=1807691 RepID=A0ABQ1V242_9BACT|nr:peptide-methionine (S)-S-oxide reductase [Echinicola rosea]GGF32869.1 peptide methionine sulfoxide reductase MsrA [Echinicola rosea]